ncbi:MAG TPA: MCE family protein [Bacteroidetes bacterium]|nr:MCE family protein [Bacteroidota bacterium]
MKVNNELKIGLTVVIAVFIGFIGFRVMKDMPVFRQGTVIYANYDRADGLSVGTPVTLRGIKIGSVQSLTLLVSDSVKVTLNINLNDGLPEGSIAYVRSIDLLGSKGIEIERGKSTVLIEHEGEIEGVYEIGFMGELAAQGSQLTENVTESSDRINLLLTELQSIMQEGGKENINQTLGNMNSATGQIDALLKETNDDLKQSIESLRKSMDNLEGLTADEEGNIKSMIANLEATSTELDVIAKNLNSITGDLSQIMRKINEGEGSLGLMVNDPNLYRNLDSLTVNMNLFMEQLNDDPKHFLRHLRLIRLF